MPDGFTAGEPPDACSAAPRPEDASLLHELVRRHRIYMEVESQFALLGGRRTRVAAELKLWGAHRRSAAASPDCILCRSIHRDLATVAGAVLSPRDQACASILPFDGQLYLSDRWGRDEIDLTIRFAAPAGEAWEAAGERLLRTVRGRLESLGVYEGGWRPSDPE